MKTFNDDRKQEEIMVIMHIYILWNSMEITHCYFCKYICSWINRSPEELIIKPGQDLQPSVEK